MCQIILSVVMNLLFELQVNGLGGNISYHHIHIEDNKTILSVVVNVLFKLR